MAEISIQVDTSEVQALAADIQRHADATQALAEKAVTKVGFDMQATAMAIAPVDTGYLKSSITLDVIGLGFDLGPTAEYGQYVELGTSRMSPEPYLGPAFDAQLPNLEQALGAIGDGAVSRG